VHECVHRFFAVPEVILKVEYGRTKLNAANSEPFRKEWQNFANIKTVYVQKMLPSLNIIQFILLFLFVERTIATWDGRDM
jgi:hypothetical protein